MDKGTSIIKDFSDSKVAQTIAIQLWPTMLFLVVMSIVSLVGAKWWTSDLDNQLHLAISFWAWFIAMLIITGFGVYVFFLDARIQLQKHNTKKAS